MFLSANICIMETGIKIVGNQPNQQEWMGLRFATYLIYTSRNIR